MSVCVWVCECAYMVGEELEWVWHTSFIVLCVAGERGERVQRFCH